LSQHAAVLRMVRIAMEAHRAEHGHTASKTEKIFQSFDPDETGVFGSIQMQRALRRVGLTLTAKQVWTLESALNHRNKGVRHAELADFLHGPDHRAAAAARQLKHQRYDRRAEEARKAKNKQAALATRAELRRIAQAVSDTKMAQAQFNREEALVR